MKRDSLKSRLGFLMLSAGCAVGLGNVWRFPFIVGQNGGAAFVLVYLVFLALMGFPLLAAEFAIGRAGRRGIAGAMRELSNARYRRFWYTVGTSIFLGCALLMAYYTDVAGWLVRCTVDFLRGNAGSVCFSSVSGDCVSSTAYLAFTIATSAGICMAGVRNGVERVVKVMMLALLVLMAVLAARALTLPGASSGVRFYLAPDWAKFFAHPWRAMFDAMAQAFFTLSIGMGCMTIFGSYIGRDHSLAAESAIVIVLDTVVALLAGLVVFPACASYGVDVTSGPGLIFDLLPKVFDNMAGGRVWGFIFFFCLSLAAITTIVTVFECLIGGLVDEAGLSRVAASTLTGVGVMALSLVTVFVDGALKWEDFVLGQIWLPLGAFMICVFASNRIGWGAEGFEREVSAGVGMKFPHFFVVLMKAVVPVLILAVLVAGLMQ